MSIYELARHFLVYQKYNLKYALARIQIQCIPNSSNPIN